MKADKVVWNGREAKMAENAVRNGAEIIYRAAVERIATALEPKFRSGELRGWIDSDDVKMDEEEKRRGFEPPLWRLEDECARRLRSTEEAFAVLLNAPFAGQGWTEYEQNYPLRARRSDKERILHAEARGKAGVALARDVLLIARTRGWYRATRGEEPSTAELRRAA